MLLISAGRCSAKIHLSTFRNSPSHADGKSQFNRFFIGHLLHIRDGGGVEGLGDRGGRGRQGGGRLKNLLEPTVYQILYTQEATQYLQQPGIVSTMISPMLQGN